MGSYQPEPSRDVNNNGSSSFQSERGEYRFVWNRLQQDRLQPFRYADEDLYHLNGSLSYQLSDYKDPKLYSKQNHDAGLTNSHNNHLNGRNANVLNVTNRPSSDLTYKWINLRPPPIAALVLIDLQNIMSYNVPPREVERMREASMKLLAQARERDLVILHSTSVNKSLALPSVPDEWELLLTRSAGNGYANGNGNSAYSYASGSDNRNNSYANGSSNRNHSDNRTAYANAQGNKNWRYNGYEDRYARGYARANGSEYSRGSGNTNNYSSENVDGYANANEYNGGGSEGNINRNNSIHSSNGVAQEHSSKKGKERERVYGDLNGGGGAYEIGANPDSAVALWRLKLFQQIQNRIKTNDAIAATLKKRESIAKMEPDSFSGISGAGIVDRLRSLGVNYLILGGLATEGAVMTTARHARELHMNCVIVGDACWDVKPPRLQRARHHLPSNTRLVKTPAEVICYMDL